MNPADPNTVIGAQPPNSVIDNQGTPQIEFYLTYYNDITASQEPGTVTIELERSVGGSVKETTTVNVRIVTKAAGLSSQTVDLYATQSDAYTGTLIIPSGTSRELTLTGVAAGGYPLVAAKAEGSAYTDGEFAVSMQAVQGDGGNGWLTSGLMTGPCDLGGFAAGSSVAIGSTDSRYDAPIKFVLTNATGFSSKDQPDAVVLTIRDGSAGDVEITLRIHWEKSAVSSVSVGAGRQYNVSPTGDAVTVSRNSALTAVYELSGTLLTNDCWLELRKDGATAAVPAGAQFTLMSGTGFYRYAATGAETDGRIELKDFVSMSGGSNAASIRGDATVILDLGSSADGLAAGSYSLVPRNERAADGSSAAWTVDDSGASASLERTGQGNGLARGTHEFKLSLTSGSDTQFSDGATVAFSLADGNSFPEGTAFVLDGTTYYASGGKVYLPLSGSGPCTVTVDTADTAGLLAGSYTLVAQVFPTGASAGNASALSAQASFDVKQNPSYGLTVSLDPGASRVVSAGDELSFTVSYSVQHAGATSPAVAMSVQKKTDGGYEDGAAWTVSGNDALGAGSGTQAIVVTVPDTLDPGTYRLLFTLGDQTAPYNLIVSG